MLVADLRRNTGVLNGAGALLHPEVVLPVGPGFRRTADRVMPRAVWMRAMLDAKRAFDILGSLALLIGLAPIFLVLLIWIPLDSAGGPIFRHARIGLHGRIFRILKFRTMRRDAHSERDGLAGAQNGNRYFFKRQNDPRVTRLGYFLRKYSLDELPQLINVLRGDMSLIGPRPLLKEDFVPLETADPLFHRWVRDRHLLWPGITGLWQVSGRSALPFHHSMELDLEYVERWSPRIDAVILLKTIPAILKGNGAY